MVLRECERGALRALVAGVGVILLQQLTGQPSVLYYADVIFADVVGGSKTTVWNGPMGVFEMAKFEAGTKSMMDTIVDQPRPLRSPPPPLSPLSLRPSPSHSTPCPLAPSRLNGEW